jgi:hypothetical protein
MGLFDLTAANTATPPANAAGAAPRCVAGELDHGPVRGLNSAFAPGYGVSPEQPGIHANPPSLFGGTPCSTR